MKPLSEQDHYEILEVSRAAAGDEIERAYRLARGTYADDSLAGYSIFGEGDVEALRQRIETAYRVLSDPEARSAYDASLAACEEGADGALAGLLPEVPTALELESERSSGMDPLEDLEDSGELDGAWLRRSRLRRGIEIEDVARITKINPTYLRFLEEERFGELPAPVYVRGFVAAYAQCVGLEPGRVASAYMGRYELARPHPRRERQRDD